MKILSLCLSAPCYVIHNFQLECIVNVDNSEKNIQLPTLDSIERVVLAQFSSFACYPQMMQCKIFLFPFIVVKTEWKKKIDHLTHFRI